MKHDFLTEADVLRLRIAALRSRLRYSPPSHDKTRLQAELNAYLRVGMAFPETRLWEASTDGNVEALVLGELSKKYTMEAILQGCGAVIASLDNLEPTS